MRHEEGRHTLQQARCALGDVFDQDLAAAVEQEAVQRRLVWIGGDGGACFVCAACATSEDLDRVARSILEQKPAAGSAFPVGDISAGAVVVPTPGFPQGAGIGLCDGDGVEPVQRHCRRATGWESSQRAPCAGLGPSVEKRPPVCGGRSRLRDSLPVRVYPWM